MAASEGAPRVALLARAGDACERIAGALREAGAELVLVADPMQAEPAQVREAQPQAVLVALEPAIEDAIERFEDVLADPDYMVIFEEAEQAALRTGWDAARWLRHLSAKLHRHNDVLPAGAELDDGLQLTAEPMQVPPAAPDFDDAIVALTDEALQHADEVPQDTLEGRLSPPEDALADHRTNMVLETQFEIEAVRDPQSADDAGFDLDFTATHDLDFDASAAAPDFTSGNEAPDVDSATLEHADAGIDFSSLTLSLDDGDEVELDGLSYDPERYSRAGQDEDAAAGIEEFLAAHARTAADDTDGTGDVEPAGDGRAAETPATSPGRMDFSSLSLVEDDQAPASPAAARAQAESFDLDALAGGLSLVDPDSYGHGRPRHGLVLIEAGLGGPDAVRQLLSSLPGAFARPILIRLPLDGGRYDRLVKQMTRATSAPVSVAEAGQVASSGSIYFVPPGLGIRADASGWIFDAGQPLDAVALLPAGDSAVLFLSGADAALVPAVTDGSWGGLVLGQTPDEGCYDPAAARAAIEAGGGHGSPTQLADMLLDRWSAPGDRPNPDPTGMQ